MIITEKNNNNNNNEEEEEKKESQLILHQIEKEKQIILYESTFQLLYLSDLISSILVFFLTYGFGLFFIRYYHPTKWVQFTHLNLMLYLCKDLSSWVNLKICIIGISYWISDISFIIKRFRYNNNLFIIITNILIIYLFYIITAKWILFLFIFYNVANKPNILFDFWACITSLPIVLLIIFLISYKLEDKIPMLLLPFFIFIKNDPAELNTGKKSKKRINQLLIIGLLFVKLYTRLSLDKRIVRETGILNQ